MRSSRRRAVVACVVASTSIVWQVGSSWWDAAAVGSSAATLARHCANALPPALSCSVYCLPVAGAVVITLEF